MPKNLILWYGSKTNEVTQKLNVLSFQGYQLKHIQKKEELLQQLAVLRPTILVVSSFDTEVQLLDNIRHIITIDELKSARMLVSCEEASETLLQLCFLNNFRDFIPINLEDKIWLFRFIYSTSSKEIHFAPWKGEASIKELLKITLPGKLVWIDSKSIHFESHLEPEIGSQLSLTGPLFLKLGTAPLALTIKNVQHTRLYYRFSVAITATFPTTTNYKILFDTITSQQSSNQSYLRALIITGSEIAKEIKKSLDKSVFITHSMRIQNIVQEAEFLSPNIVFIDENLINEKNKDIFKKLESSLLESTQIFFPYIKQKNEPIYNLFEKFSPQYIDLSSLETRKNLKEALSISMQKKRANEGERLYIQKNHHLSSLSVFHTAKLASIHPLSCLIQLPFKIRKFAIIQISSAFLKEISEKKIWVKIIGLNQKPSPPWKARGLFLNFNPKDIEVFTAKILKHLQNELANPLELFAKENSELFNFMHLPQEGIRKIPLPAEIIKEDDSYVAPKPKTKKHSLGEIFYAFRYLMFFVAFTVISIILISFVAPIIARNYPHSGQTFIQQLKIFSNQKEED